MKNALSSKFGVRGIPTLIFFEANGDIATKDGRDVVSTDPNGDKYPWIPKSFSEEIAGPLLSHSGKTYEFAELAGKTIALYFSAHWCGPCRSFTPKLIETYKNLNSAGKPFEIIFVSADNDEEEFEEYFKEMPWLSIPFDDPRLEYLNRRFEVEGIPSLVLISETGETIRDDLRSVIEHDPLGKDFPWPRRAIGSFDVMLSSINDVPTLAIFTDGCESQVQAAKEALKAASDNEEAWASREKKPFRIHFAYSTTADEQPSRVRTFLNLDATPLPTTVLINVPSASKAVISVGGAVSTSDQILAAVDSFFAKKLPSVPLRE